MLALMHEVGADRGRFKQHFQIEKVEHLPKSRFNEAVSLCEKRRNR